jgi:hypothetical protein
MWKRFDLPKPFPNSSVNLSTQCVDYFFAVIGALFPQNVGADAVADLPVKHYQNRINRLGDLVPRLADESPQVIQ